MGLLYTDLFCSACDPNCKQCSGTTTQCTKCFGTF